MAVSNVSVVNSDGSSGEDAAFECKTSPLVAFRSFERAYSRLRMCGLSNDVMAWSRILEHNVFGPLSSNRSLGT